MSNDEHKQNQSSLPPGDSKKQIDTEQTDQRINQQTVSIGENISLETAKQSSLTDNAGSKGKVYIKAYDFYKPDRFTSNHIKSLTAVHNVFAREFAASLQYLPGIQVRLGVESFAQVSFPEFIGLVPSPSVIYVVELNPVGVILFNINPDGALRLVDAALGGSGDLGTVHSGLTAIEQDVMLSIISHSLVPALRMAWKPFLDVTPEILYFEPDAANLQFPRDEIYIFFSLKIEMNNTPEIVNICYPCTVIEHLFTLLAGGKLYTGLDNDFSGYWQNQLQQANLLKQYLAFNLSGVRITLQDITGWGETVALALPGSLQGTARLQLLGPEEVYHA